MLVLLWSVWFFLVINCLREGAYAFRLRKAAKFEEERSSISLPQEVKNAYQGRRQEAVKAKVSSRAPSLQRHGRQRHHGPEGAKRLEPAEDHEVHPVQLQGL